MTTYCQRISPSCEFRAHLATVMRHQALMKAVGSLRRFSTVLISPGLAVAFGEGTCPAELPGDHDPYYR